VCVEIAGLVRSGALEGVLGETGGINVQGERVQQLDDLSNDLMLEALKRTGSCAGYASEEMELAALFGEGEYLVTSDPLDGSSNIDFNVSIGTIFGVYHAGPAGFLAPGRTQAAAGYAVYGPSTMFVITNGVTVDGFTLRPGSPEDLGVGDFLLTHPGIICPQSGATYSINDGYHDRWSPGVRAWNAYIKRQDPETGPAMSLRYVGSMVSDAHRTLLKGGIYLYPEDSTAPDGKLRLSYECNPIALIFETAGGAATDGRRDILDIAPTVLHQRTPIVIGSRDNVALYGAFHSGERE
jgi:fructose-1,6-bisphosphatase I